MYKGYQICGGTDMIQSGPCFLFRIDSYTVVRCYNNHISEGFSTFVFKFSILMCSFTYIREQLATYIAKSTLHLHYILYIHILFIV